MTYLCIDTETTGIPEDGQTHGLVEVGRCRLRFDIIHDPEGMLVNCGIPISIGARATHHISDADVVGAATPDAACAWLMEGDHQYFCAHNSDFDRKFFSGGAIPWIDTYKTALRIWPDAPGHKLMELAYHLKLDEADDFGAGWAFPLHRAAGDAYVCAHLLRRILKEGTPIDKLVKWSSGPALLSMCWLKKYKGSPWSQVPADYLDWIVNKSDIKDRDIRATANFYLKQKTR